MKVALIGHGSMGRVIERLARERGHEVVVASRELSEISGCDVAIDFSAADAVRGNVEACVAAGVPIVVGTTGWDSEREEVEKIVAENNGAMVYGANFSLGVNIFYKVADFAAALFAKFPEYEAFIEEQHHSRKKDAPSGTALKLKEIVLRYVEVGDVAATRAGNIPGTHRVGFDGPADQIALSHTARSREGFALGAIMAAAWIIGRKGFFEFGSVMDKVSSGADLMP